MPRKLEILQTSIPRYTPFTKGIQVNRTADERQSSSTQSCSSSGCLASTHDLLGAEVRLAALVLDETGIHNDTWVVCDTMILEMFIEAYLDLSRHMTSKI